MGGWEGGEIGGGGVESSSSQRVGWGCDGLSLWLEVRLRVELCRLSELCRAGSFVQSIGEGAGWLLLLSLSFYRRC